MCFFSVYEVVLECTYSISMQDSNTMLSRVFQDKPLTLTTKKFTSPVFRSRALSIIWYVDMWKLIAWEAPLQVHVLYLVVFIVEKRFSKEVCVYGFNPTYMTLMICGLDNSHNSIYGYEKGPKLYLNSTQSTLPVVWQYLFMCTTNIL